MAWRGIHLSRKAYLSVENRALKIVFREADHPPFRQSLEDLSYLILDTPEITLSGSLLAALADAGTLVLGVDTRHLPCWTSLPWTRYHRHGEVLQDQLEATLPQKKQLWAHIVKAKLKAQSLCLLVNGLAGSDAIEAMALRVRSGDADNTEARAARHYWQHLFPNRPFRRHDDDLPNALLNYGYALLRAALARNLCAIGFIPQLGIHHNSITNAFNLADDLIEPYRPLADHFALQALSENPSATSFGTEHRRSMARLLEAEMHIGQEVFSTMNAIENTASSLKHAYMRKDPSALLFPSLFTT